MAGYNAAYFKQFFNQIGENQTHNDDAPFFSALSIEWKNPYP